MLPNCFPAIVAPETNLNLCTKGLTHIGVMIMENRKKFNPDKEHNNVRIMDNL